MAKGDFGGKRHILTDEDRKKGGESTKQKYQKQGELKEILNVWLQSEQGRDKEGNTMTGAEVMAMKAIQEMMKGNSKFWELVRDTAGQKPVDKIMVAEVEQETIDEIEALVASYDERHGG